MGLIEYFRKRMHPFATSLIMLLAAAAFLSERNLGVPGAYMSGFYLLIFVLLTSSILNTLRKDLTEDYIVRDNIFMWFLTGFVGSRLLVATAGIGEPGTSSGQVVLFSLSEVWLGGYHLHHYLWGLGLISISSILMLEKADISRKRVAALFGLGLGILFDEIGLLLSLENYSDTVTFPIVAVMAVLLYVNAERDVVRKGYRKMPF